MIDGLIFDVDGTIWDSTKIVANAWNKAFEEEGYIERVDADRLKGLFGLPMIDIITDILPYETVERKQKLLKIVSKYEFVYLENEMPDVYEGMGETLEFLSTKYKLGIVSNCQSGYIELLYAKTGFEKYFEYHLCPGDTNLLKADNIKILADKCGMRHPIYIGDTHMDEEASNKAGVQFVFAEYGFGKAISPWKTIKNIKNLKDILL